MSTHFCKKIRKTSWHSLQGRQMPAGNKSTPAVLKTQKGLLQMQKCKAAGGASPSPTAKSTASTIFPAGSFHRFAVPLPPGGRHKRIPAGLPCLCSML